MDGSRIHAGAQVGSVRSELKGKCVFFLSVFFGFAELFVITVSTHYCLHLFHLKKTLMLQLYNYTITDMIHSVLSTVWKRFEEGSFLLQYENAPVHCTKIRQ